MIVLVAVLALWPILCLTQDTTDPSRALYYVKEDEKDVVCASKLCINQCCPQGQNLNCPDEEIGNCTCIPTDRETDFSSYKLYSDKVFGEEVKIKFNEAFVIVPSYLSTVNDSFLPNSVKASELSVGLGLYSYLGVDGKIQLKTPNAYDRYETDFIDSFCIFFNRDISSIDIILLFRENEEKDNVLYVYAMLISTFFLMLVLLVYALLPDLRNLPGKILMAYVFSQMMAFLSLCIMQLHSLKPNACIIMSGVIYCSFLASFCWLNVMSYDIFWTFRSYAKAREHRRGENFKFVMYCIYAWGVPLALTVMMIVMNSTDFSDKPWIIKPLINDRGCFLMGGQKFVYLYVPMLILIVCNWVFFLLTVFNIWRVNRGTAVLRSPAAGNAAAHRAHKHRFVLYIKLSVVMGVNWLLEVVSSFYPKLKGWWITDLYNLLIGVTIFIIFVFRWKIYKDLKEKYSKIGLSRWSTANSSTNSTTESQLSQEIPLRVSKNPRGSNI